MLYKVKELVFGLNEFEKTKIELRFEMIESSLSNIRLEEIRDFEILEEIIYKIKELLRIKSSNLNRVIQNPGKKLKKKDVLRILEILNKIKYDFLRQAFTIIKNPQKLSSNNKEREELSEEESRMTQTQTKSEKVEEREDEVDKKRIDVEDNSTEQIILETSEYKIVLENGKVPYIYISFVNEVDFALLKVIGAVFFESYTMEGTNMIIEEKSALIIPRLMNDRLLTLPQTQRDVSSDYEKIITTIETQNLDTKEEKEKSGPSEFQNSERELNVETQTQTQEGEYRELDKKPEFKKSSKQDDLSLDALLSGDEKPEFKSKPDPTKDENDIIVSTSEPIEVEKKKVVEKPEDERIEIEKKEFVPKESKSILDISSINQNLVLYKDDKIIAYIEENSIVLGEIVIKPLNGNTIKKMNESDMSYMIIFSKIFSSILFEIMEAHGTNLLFNYENNYMKVVVRFQNDNLPLKWNPKEESDSFLEDLRGKLLEKMHNALDSEDSGHEGGKPAQKVTEEPVKKTPLTHEKAKYILDSLKRIP